MAIFNSLLYVYQRVSQTLSQWLLTPRYEAVINILGWSSKWSKWIYKWISGHRTSHGCCGAGIVRANMPCFLANIGAGAWLWPSKNRHPSVFRPNFWVKIYPESTSDFVRSNSIFFGTWAVSGKFGVVVGNMFENSFHGQVSEYSSIAVANGRKPLLVTLRGLSHECAMNNWWS